MERTTTLDTGEVQRYVELTARKRELQAELASVQATLDELEPRICEMMLENGVQHLRTLDHTVFLSNEIWAAPIDGDYDSLCRALSQIGQDSMVQTRVNLQTLSAWVREFRKAGEDIPKEVEPYIKISETTRVRVRKI